MVCLNTQLHRDTRSWRCKAFRDIALKERDKIKLDNEMHLFCLLHGKEEICYATGTGRKFTCPVPSCKGEHDQWLLEVLSNKSVSMNLVGPEKEEQTMWARKGGSWLDM